MKTKTSRAIIHFPYQSKTTGKTYNSVLLGLENASGKYSLPGGQFDPNRDRNTEDTVRREVKEELGLDISSAKKIFSYAGHVCEHDVYLVQARGTLKVDPQEIRSIGFLNAGRHNQIPGKKLESHVKAMFNEYFGTSHQTRRSSPVSIPGHYFTGWVNQRKKFKKC
jgi:8-oxo-dGTP pyrophosphatase MutT (NUDIX family)